MEGAICEKLQWPPRGYQCQQRQADEVVAYAVTALRRLALLDTASEVVLGGGVLAAQAAVLMTPIESALAQRAPLATVVVPRSRPLVGAALLGLEQLTGAPVPEDVERRIAEQLALPG